MMNPDKELEAIRELVEHYHAGGGLEEEQVAELIEAIGRLDDWIENGGHLPHDWRMAKGCRRPARPPRR